MNSWYTIRAQSTGAEVVIYDEIGAYGVSAKGPRVPCANAARR